MTESVAYISSDERRRITHFDESVESTASFLSDVHVAEVMGATVVQRYVSIVNRLRLPNFIQDEVDIAHFDDADIPFVPVFEGDDFNISDEYLYPNQAQRQIIEAQFGKNIVEREWSLDDESDGLTVSFQHFQDVGGDIYSPARQMAFKRRCFEDYWVFTGRPALIENATIHISRFAPVMIHELTHVDQHETEPVLRYNDRQKVSVGMEVRAYRKQCLATKALHLMGRGDELDTIPRARGFDDYAKKVDTIVRGHAKDRVGFQLTDAMIEDIVAFDPIVTGNPIDW